jgi:hypothetical protein
MLQALDILFPIMKPVSFLLAGNHVSLIKYKLAQEGKAESSPAADEQKRLCEVSHAEEEIADQLVAIRYITNARQ